MSQIEVQIMGQGYLLTCPVGGEERMIDAVHKVDAAMCKIRDAGKVRARDRIAVLASLNLAVELAEAQSQLQEAQAELNHLKSLGAGSVEPPSAPVPSPSNPPGPDTQRLLTEWMARIDRALDTDGQLL